MCECYYGVLQTVRCGVRGTGGETCANMVRIPSMAQSILRGKEPRLDCRRGDCMQARFCLLPCHSSKGIVRGWLGFSLAILDWIDELPYVNEISARH